MEEKINPKEEASKALEERIRQLEEENRQLKVKVLRKQRKQRKAYISQIRRDAANKRWSKARATAEANNLKSNLERNEEYDEFDEVIGELEEKRAFYEKRRKAFMEEHKSFGMEYETLRKSGMGYLVENIVNLEKECKVLWEANILLRMGRDAFKDGASCRNRESEIVGSKLNDYEAYIASHEGERNANAEGFTFTQEAWEVIDENWEELKKAVYKIKVKKEKTPYVRLPMEGWSVLDKYFDELAKLFHL